MGEPPNMEERRRKSSNTSDLPTCKPVCDGCFAVALFNKKKLSRQGHNLGSSLFMKFEKAVDIMSKYKLNVKYLR